MPITLGCPSCGKRFRARDESAGKRVKCPYCGAPVSVPTAAESAVAAAPTDSIPVPPSQPDSAPPPGRPVPPPAPAPVASAADWGAKPAEPASANPFGSDATRPGRAPSAKPAPKPAKAPASRPFPGSTTAAGGETPEQAAARAWRKSRRGLGWVLFGLFFLALPGFAEFGKEMYHRSTGNALPSGSGGDWISIDGMINSGAKAVSLSKQEIINVGCYVVPFVFAGLFLFLGRLRASCAPRSSGAKGLFAFSGLFTLVAFAGLGAALVCEKMADTPTDIPAKQVSEYGAAAFLFCGFLAEFWFLTGLTASGLSLNRPKVARAVGMVAFFAALVAALMTVGWEVYTREFRAITPDSRFYETMAFMICWLLVVGVYWRAVRSTRIAIRDFLETVEE
jgi:hypothetical protein